MSVIPASWRVFSGRWIAVGHRRPGPWRAGEVPKLADLGPNDEGGRDHAVGGHIGQPLGPAQVARWHPHLRPMGRVAPPPLVHQACSGVGDRYLGPPGRRRGEGAGPEASTPWASSPQPLAVVMNEALMAPTTWSAPTMRVAATGRSRWTSSPATLSRRRFTAPFNAASVPGRDLIDVESGIGARGDLRRSPVPNARRAHGDKPRLGNRARLAPSALPCSVVTATVMRTQGKTVQLPTV